MRLYINNYFIQKPNVNVKHLLEAPSVLTVLPLNLVNIRKNLEMTYKIFKNKYYLTFLHSYRRIIKQIIQEISLYWFPFHLVLKCILCMFSNMFLGVI